MGYSYVRREKEHHSLEGSQASPARLSDKIRIKMKTLRWLEAEDGGHGILISELSLMYNLRK
jgi:hypothetical protein